VLLELSQKMFQHINIINIGTMLNFFTLLSFNYNLLFKQVDDVNDVKPVPTAETYVYSDKTFIAQGGFGKVYGATKYKSDGSKDSTKPYVLKLVATLVDAQKECNEYAIVPPGPTFITCYGTATYNGKGFALLDDAGPDLDKILSKGHLPEADRKIIVKGLMSAIKVLFTLQKVHRDIKPQNVCYKNGVVKLIDFGLMYDWGTEATVVNIDRLSRRGHHATAFYEWPVLTEYLRYKSKYKVSDQTKLAYVTKMKKKLYLVDVGGVFVTHFKMIKPYSYYIDTDVYSYFDIKAASKTLRKKIDFWTRKNISADEKAVLYALKDTSKSIDDILGMAWLA